MTAGKVRKVDKRRGKVTLDHAEIASLGMPPMTMEFDVADRALLGAVKPGDKVRFQVGVINGEVLMTRIEPVR
ncbi:hypothetical protein BH09PSE5_BH09PSE5_50850 [soil metagenome]